MIYPATLDLRILQNSTFRLQLRVLQNVKAARLNEVVANNAIPYFQLRAHNFTAGTKVVFLPAVQASAELPALVTPSAVQLPDTLGANQIYFVNATGLTANTFTVSATEGGSPITLDIAPGQDLFVAQPLNLTGYTIDSDIYGLLDNELVASFTGSIPTPLDGVVELLLPAATSLPLESGRYSYDTTLITPAAERYYWLQGTIQLDATRSRVPA